MRLGPFVLICLIGSGWGLHFLFTKALGSASVKEALAFLVLYILGTASGLLALGLLGSRAYRPTWGQVRFFAISSSFGYLGPILAELIIAPNVNAGIFALIAGATPVTTVAIAALFGFERVTVVLAGALAAGSASALVLLGPGAEAGGPVFWIALAFVVPLLYGADNVYIERAWPKGLDSLQVAAGEGVVATVICASVALAFGVRADDIAVAADRGGWLLAGLILTSFVSTWLYFHVAHGSGAVFVSFASYIAILAGVLGGVLFFAERPGWPLALAAALLIVALRLLARHRQAHQS